MFVAMSPSEVSIVPVSPVAATGRTAATRCEIKMSSLASCRRRFQVFGNKRCDRCVVSNSTERAKDELHTVFERESLNGTNKFWEVAVEAHRFRRDFLTSPRASRTC